MMKVILKEDVPHLGVVGELVAVKDGYGRNYLIPQGKALLASPRSVRELDHQKRLASHHREQATAQAQTDKDKIEALSIAFPAKTAPPPLNEDSEPMVEILPKLFGSVTNRDVASVLRESGFKVEHRRVTLSEHVGTLGRFEAAVRLDGGVIATVPFWVIPEGVEDVEQAKKDVEQAQIDAVAAEDARIEAEAAMFGKKSAAREDDYPDDEEGYDRASDMSDD